MNGAHEHLPPVAKAERELVGGSEERVHNEHELVAASLNAKLALNEAMQAAPGRAEELEVLRKRLDSLITDANEALKTLGAVAAVGDVLEGARTKSTEQSGLVDPQTLVENPDKAEQLLEGVIAITENVSDDPAHRALSNEAKAALAEIPRTKQTGRRLALTIAERVAKICLDLAGLGAVSHALDLIEDCTRVFMENRRAATA